VPVEFKLTSRGERTSWEGPQVNGANTGIYVYAWPQDRHSHPQVNYDALLRSKKADARATAVLPMNYPFKVRGKPVYGFGYREPELLPGTAEPKRPEESHSWFVLVFAYRFEYQVTVASSLRGFQEGAVREAFERILKSFRPIEIPGLASRDAEVAERLNGVAGGDRVAKVGEGPDGARADVLEREDLVIIQPHHLVDASVVDLVVRH
jgi:hypothetical protein